LGHRIECPGWRPNRHWSGLADWSGTGRLYLHCNKHAKRQTIDNGHFCAAAWRDLPKNVAAQSPVLPF